MSNGQQGSGPNPPGPRSLRVKFDLGEFGGPFDLDINEVADWFRREMEFWGWLGQIQNDSVSNNLRIAVQAELNAFLKDCRPHIDTLPANPTVANAEAVGHAIQNAFTTHRVPYSGSPRGVFLKSLFDKDHIIALGAAAYLLRLREMPLLANPHYRGFIKAALFEAGIDASTTESATTALSALHQEWQARLTESSERARTLLDALEKERLEAAQSLAQIKKTSQEDFEHNRGVLEDSKRTWDQEFEKLRTTYDTQLALKAPVTYWSEKRKSHTRTADRLRRWVAAFFVAGFAFLGWDSVDLLGGSVSSVSKLPLWHFVTIGVGLVLFVWGARLLVRSMLTHQHLAIDAHERIVAANTFLALMRGGHLDASDKKELLATLLRHSSDGIVKDDAMPWADVIAAVKGRGAP